MKLFIQSILFVLPHFNFCPSLGKCYMLQSVYFVKDVCEK